MFEEEKVEAQRALDELWSEKAVPFELNVVNITRDLGEYRIHFNDSRMRIAPVPLVEGHSFKEMVRAAVLARVKRMSGPFQKPTEEAHTNRAA